MIFNEEHELIRQLARDFAERELGPIASEIDRTGVFPMDLYRKMGELGFLGVFVPKEYGGAGADLSLIHI